MGPKKGKSLEEKRQCLLKIYYDSGQPFNLKEIEKEGSKVGVVQQMIKEVNQSLVDDSMVMNDKIGSGVFFWSFKSKQYQDLVIQTQKIDNMIERAEENVKILGEMKEAAEVNRCDIDRDVKIARLKQLQQEEIELNTIIEESKRNDPEEINRINKLGDANRDSANRWVDNTYAVKSFLTKKRGLPSKEADKYLGINDDFDYYDDSMILLNKKKKK
jgi:nitrogen fixation-related uncharacterized protein